ncbi:MAG: hypothetical protein SWX82_12775 [Cyanobacteriota bacterium]|nr:hypothetical protein [Cyanobacteriota bacterium]
MATIMTKKQKQEKGIIAKSVLKLFNYMIKKANDMGYKNPHYEVSEPVEDSKLTIKKNSSIMPNKKIYNRKVYMLIDQSGSMA